MNIWHPVSQGQQHLEGELRRWDRFGLKPQTGEPMDRIWAETLAIIRRYLETLPTAHEATHEGSDD